MKVKSVTVGYGQTVAGPKRFEGERFDITISVDLETKEEQDPQNAKKVGKKLFEEARKAVEAKSGRRMRRAEPQ